MSPSRRTAYEILGSVDRGGQAAELLDERAAKLDSRDAGLATQIVFGVLRRQRQLDWLIGQASARPLEKLDPSALRALRMGAFQIRFLDRVPTHAAVDESVELVKRAGKREAAGYVNAVLRRLPPAPEEWPSEGIRYSMPDWLWERWRRNLGDELAGKAAAAGLAEPEPYLRRERRMDIGAQSVVPLLELAPAHRFLDVCAAPGNKTLQAMESGAWTVACDANARRLRGLLAACPRVLADAGRGLPFGAVFDRLLVDAPCTGTGTLARNPEIRWRLTPGEVRRQAARQERILKEALRCLKPGGRLVYSTCSLEPEENEEVVRRAAAGRVRKTMFRCPGREPGDGFFAAVIE